MGFCFSLSFTIHGLSELPMYKSYPQQQQQPGSMVDLRAYTAEKKTKVPTKLQKIFALAAQLQKFHQRSGTSYMSGSYKAQYFAQLLYLVSSFTPEVGLRKVGGSWGLVSSDIFIL